MATGLLLGPTGARSILRRRWAELALALAILVFAATTMAWIRRDTAPPLWDSAYYLQHSAILYDALTRDGVVAFLGAFSRSMDQKAPLVAALPIPVYFLRGEDHTSARFVNLAWIVVGSIYLFRIGKLVAGEAAGLVAVIVLNTFPLVAGMSRQYLVEYGLMAMAILWIYYLQQWQRGASGTVPWILGTALGFGLLLKVTLPLYIAAPTVLVAWQKLSQGYRARSLLLDVARVTVVALPLAALWYARHLGEVSGFVISGGFGELGQPYGTGPIFSLQAIGTYWLSLVNFGVSFFYFVLLVLVFAAGALRWRRAPARTAFRGDRDLQLLLVWWLAPALALTFLANKDQRYAVPYLPALAVLLAAGLSGIASRSRRAAAFVAVAALGLLNYFHYSFGMQWLGTENRLGRLVLLSPSLVWGRPPTADPWPGEEVLRLVAEDAARFGGMPVNARVLFSHPCLNAHVLNYLATLREATPRFSTVHFQTPEPLSNLIEEINSGYHYVLTKSGSPGPGMLNTRNLEVASALRSGAIQFAPVAMLPLPDGSAVTVHRRLELGRSFATRPSWPTAPF